MAHALLGTQEQEKEQEQSKEKREGGGSKEIRESKEKNEINKQSKSLRSNSASASAGEGEEYESETYSENDTKLSDVLEGDTIHAKLSLLWQWACLHPFVVFITGVALFWFCQFPWIAWMIAPFVQDGLRTHQEYVASGTGTGRGAV